MWVSFFFLFVCVTFLFVACCGGFVCVFLLLVVFIIIFKNHFLKKGTFPAADMPGVGWSQDGYLAVELRTPMHIGSTHSSL